MFKFFSRATYSRADAIITITGVNQPKQLRDGADPERMRVIPNGIDVQRFAALRRAGPRRPDTPVTVGFVGRVVPIKDLKTFLRAMKVCQQQLPRLQVKIVGPYDEDREYYEECLRLTDELGLRDLVEFTGKVDVTKHYPSMDVVVLTSTSEAVPLVILEANCAGIPVVATDVGACAELLLGRTAQDRALGPSGIITPVSSPEATGAAVVRLARDEGLRLAMGRAGVVRVERFYRLENLNRDYEGLYRRLAGAEAPR